MGTKRKAPFNVKRFLSQIGGGKTLLACRKKQILFSQGDVADSVFYIQTGRVKLSVVSQRGKEAVIALMDAGSFFGEGCLAGKLVRLTSATVVDASTIVRIDKHVMIHVLENEPIFSSMFLEYVLARNLRIQEDLVDQLFNSAEKRLARTLLLLAHSEREATPEMVIPRISQETLAEMVGTTRSRVSFFMNRFKKLGFIEYLKYLSLIHI